MAKGDEHYVYPGFIVCPRCGGQSGKYGGTPAIGFTYRHCRSTVNGQRCGFRWRVAAIGKHVDTGAAESTYVTLRIP